MLPSRSHMTTPQIRVLFLHPPSLALGKPTVNPPLYSRTQYPCPVRIFYKMCIRSSYLTRVDMQVHVCRCICVCVHVCVMDNVRGCSGTVILVLRQSLVYLKLTCWARLADWQTPVNLSLITLALGLQTQATMPGFLYSGPRD